MTDSLTLASPPQDSSHVTCPLCSRVEVFDHELVAWAWCIGHIQEAHPDALPAFVAGGETDG